MIKKYRLAQHFELDLFDSSGCTTEGNSSTVEGTTK